MLIVQFDKNLHLFEFLLDEVRSVFENQNILYLTMHCNGSCEKILSVELLTDLYRIFKSFTIFFNLNTKIVLHLEITSYSSYQQFIFNRVCEVNPGKRVYMYVFIFFFNVQFCFLNSINMLCIFITYIFMILINVEIYLLIKLKLFEVESKENLMARYSHQEFQPDVIGHPIFVYCSIKVFQCSYAIVFQHTYTKIFE